VDSATVVDYLGSAAHEYFHVWNVKRIRPAALGPFDYTVEQYEPSLWVAEGWTQYYGELSRERAGLVSRDSLYATIGRWITYERGTPARAWVSARQASFDAPFWDGAATRMAVDPSGSWINYYLKGAALALLLDAELRGRTNGARSLDDALRALKRRSWDAPTTSYYLPGRGYTERDVEDAVSEVAGADLHPWFARYVGGTEPLPYDETLALIGLRVEAGGQGDGGTREYRVVEKPDASEQARALRDAWLAGRTSAEH
jgi:predicted metalloprotease with PDZ domain